jgi:hypothetical protein
MVQIHRSTVWAKIQLGIYAQHNLLSARVSSICPPKTSDEEQTGVSYRLLLFGLCNRNDFITAHCIDFAPNWQRRLSGGSPRYRTNGTQDNNIPPKSVLGFTNLSLLDPITRHFNLMLYECVVGKTDFPMLPECEATCFEVRRKFVLTGEPLQTSCSAIEAG